ADEVVAWLDGRRDRLLDLSSAPLRGRAGKALAPLAELLGRIAREGNDLAPRVRAAADFYLPRLRDLYPDDWPDRQADLKELLRMAEERDNLRLFLDELTLDPPNQKKIDPEAKKETLTLSTVHSAKGLEWKAVFILSAVEGRFPPAYAARSAAEVEEERRLMYVAVTRAEDRLFIMLPLGAFDRRTGALAAPSRFLAALPSEAGLGFHHHGRDLAPAEARAWLNQGPAAGGHYFPAARPPVPEAAGRPRPASQGTGADLPAEAEAGQRVSHPIYGAGRVTEVRGSRATIDFDLFGKKNVIIEYAKLVKI
ncbi:MAG: ATP-dependent helicase, partial [Candidatus Adiutrix sp.]|nr:ATP-dependent helicase [Candidatus Adiutrix sp.]